MLESRASARESRRPRGSGQGLFVVRSHENAERKSAAHQEGTVERVLAKEGQAVNAGEVLAWVE